MIKRSAIQLQWTYFFFFSGEGASGLLDFTKQEREIIKKVQLKMKRSEIK